MNRLHHAAGLSGTCLAILGSFSLDDFARVAAIFSGVACGLFYSAKFAATLRDKFFDRQK